MAGLRSILHEQLFVGARPDGRLTLANRVLVPVIVAAVATAVLATEPGLPASWHRALVVSELVFGGVFLVEYAARVFAAAEEPGDRPGWRKRIGFMLSPLGLLDLLVVVSTLLPLVTADAAMLRTIRLLRVLTVMKFGRFSKAMRELRAAIADRADDLIVTAALAFVFILIGATALYLIEGRIQPDAFGSIARALWWAVMTFTTVGYGDVYPVTALGKLFASAMALAGIAFVAMPTGIVAAAFSEAMQRRRDRKIEEMRAHLARLDRVDEAVEAKIAALQRTGPPQPRPDQP